MNKIEPIEEDNLQIPKKLHDVNLNKNNTERCRNQSSDFFLNSEINNHEKVQQNEHRDIESPKNDVQYNESHYQYLNQNENPQKSNKSHSIAPSKNQQQCRICLSYVQDEEAKHLGQLLSICDCKGSIQYVHYLCQKDLLEAKNGKTIKMIVYQAERLRNEPSRQIIQQKKIERYRGIKFHKCDLCGYNYEVEWKSSLKLRPLSHMKTKKKCYLYAFCVLLVSFLLLLFGLIYISLIDYNNYSKVSETIFTFLGYMLIIFAIISNTIILLVVSFRLFLVRTYFVKSIQKQRVK
ncbi:RING-variant domain protein (macronuclear) [Tetrahymena thermophila SB210]|uniref:RING-variant domain protein n=1 Tax=Tetrahymena thermophila (strain SB210) TaxID=312017 RepID=I7M7Q6_TETTS|nr:RING-variant domain protein [Tetrahymena thermophila SB210]EAR95654.2 RING-variant domain protein [Tetrahymena thermophila SB210]|eukprot:XP_001015899.2 RING-variant domain protein [Tetrahymena thermophila SB210]